MKKYIPFLVLGFIVVSSCTLMENSGSETSFYGIARSAVNNKLWQQLGEENFSEISEKHSPLTIYAGVPYMAFIEGGQLSVMKYHHEDNEWLFVGGKDFKNGVKEVSLYVDANGIYAVYIDEIVGNKLSVVQYNEVSGSWNYVGFKGFGPMNPKNISIAGDSEKLYVAYRTSQGKAQVQVFKDGRWVRLGPVSISAGNIKLNELSLKVDKTAKVPYIAYIDMANNSKVTVQKYQGNAWITVGEAGFSPTKAVKLSFTLDTVNNTPYILYTRPNGMETIMKFNALSWNIVGGADAPITSQGLISLEVEDGTVYTAYKNSMAGSKVSAAVYKTAWNFIGDVEISEEAVQAVSLVVEESVPYLAYKKETDGKIIIKKYDVPAAPKEYTWQTAGDAGFSVGSAYWMSMVKDSEGTLYLAFRDDGMGSKARVIKYRNNTWINVGQPTLSVGLVDWISLTIDHNDRLYIAFTDYSYGVEATVMSYDESLNRWQYVGEPGFTPDDAYDISIAVDNNGVPYISFRDEAYSYEASVMKYNGNTWVYVGTPGITTHDVHYTSIAIDSEGTPYIAFRDCQYSWRARVMRYNGSSWVDVGSPGFSIGTADWTSLRIAQDDTLYIAYRDVGYNYKVAVKKFNGVSWENVGSPVLHSVGNTAYFSFVLDDEGVPYIGLEDQGRPEQATVMKFNGMVWEYVGTPGFSQGNIHHYNNLIVDQKGVPYFAYRDSANGSKLTVMKYDLAPPAEE